MRMMKRILAIGLSAMMALSFAGCGNTDTSAVPEDSLSSAAVEKDGFSYRNPHALPMHDILQGREQQSRLFG